LSQRVKFHFIARLAPLVEPNFNFIELGPRGTGKSYFYSEFSPYSTLISGGQATKATLFYNNARGKVGLVGFWDTVAFDEVGGIKIRDQDTIQIMKDFMANGRFSRGVEVIADASLAFVGNIDLSIEQIVNSTEHDLFQPMPKEFDLAVMDRFALYLPGWEMPKNSSDFLTENFGFITDYLAEAFHYMFQHSNRYEEVSKRIRLGSQIEGRDEKGINKTVCAFLKMLHPDAPPTDEEFDEYVAYAVECRRRVKEQMNKRKADEEFAKINLSYMNSAGEEVFVHCPESQNALATLSPVRKTLDPKEPVDEKRIVKAAPGKSGDIGINAVGEPDVKYSPKILPQEKHFTIKYDETGHTYESLIGDYLNGAKVVTVEDPYIRITHQIANFVRFCEALVKLGNVKKIVLITGYDEETPIAEVTEKLTALKQSLMDLDIFLDVQFSDKIHDREIRFDNGWIIKIGRGLDFYQKPNDWFEIGANDLSLRKCLETKVDIFKLNI
ncbi:MAG TPA: BREX system Lon protease-like protein BrxL, partial [Pyrinomonadaceae bacterium]